jgi:hypothetical protein
MHLYMPSRQQAIFIEKLRANARACALRRVNTEPPVGPAPAPEKRRFLSHLLKPRRLASELIFWGGTPAALANALLFVGIAWLTAGCAGQEGPAKLALDQINTEMEMASPDALKYLPDQTIFVRKELARLNASFEAQDYPTVLADSPAALVDAKHLVAAATAKRHTVVMQLVHEWTTLDASLPPLFSAVRTRLDALSKVRHGPKGVDVTTVKTDFAEGSALWDKGEVLFDAGRIEDAVASLKDAKPKVEAAAAALQLPVSGTN